MTVPSSNSEPLGIESKLWEAADKLRGSVDSAEYKHVVLGLVFLKYVSDTYEAHRDFLERATSNPDDEYYVEDPEQRHAVIEDRDEYLAENGCLRLPWGDPRGGQCSAGSAVLLG